MRHDYALEKLYLATLGLVRGDGSVKERLEDAAIELTVLRPEDDIPKSHLEEFRSISAALACRSPERDGEGMIHATIRHMSEREAGELAGRIFHLYAKVLHGNPL